ncbi:NAD(P)H-binding protein [Leifsonia sp. PS1209]|uniref:NAD(P)H-binding protein n=1 Tax=Leifsonia sp. PS1209 TaxID=2724914 RepID=UPI001442ACD5|nr:NAD(P)H-binding protein [Leifsonia sp. PS1209]QIZ98097.1 NAD(P)H-binding protein [Leifsonia sp. PS1209]
MSVVVVGASGAVGSLVVSGLVERGMAVRATSRTPQTLSLPSDVKVFAADLNEPASFEPALAGADRVFLYADLEDPGALVAQLVRSGIRDVVLLSSSAVTLPGASDDFNGSRFLRVERAIEASGLGYTFLRPGGFASNAARWSWSVKGESAVPLPYPEAVQVPIHEADIADVALVALTGDTLRGAKPLLTGPERLTLREQVATIGEVIGRTVSVIEQTEAESVAMLSQYVPEVWVRQIVKDWREAVGAEPAVSGEYARIMGRAGRTFREWVGDHVELFR